jgi:hypothetical protein
MALGSPLELTHSATDYDFHQRKVNGNEVTYYREGTTLTEPEELLVRHSTNNTKAGVTIDRHNQKLSLSERDTNTGLINVMSIDVTITVPRTGQFTEAEVARAMGLLYDLLTGDSRLPRILAGES